MGEEDPFEPHVVPVMYSAFFLVLWLFLGSLTMLAVNESRPHGISEWAFVRGMVVWPWQLIQNWSAIRLLVIW